MGNVSSIVDLLPKQGQEQEQEQMGLRSQQHEEITHEGWQYGLRRLRALHPGAEWPTFDDSAGWAALIKDWKLALKKMTQDQWLKAVDYYERSSQIKYPPSPASIWVVLDEIEQIDQRERDGGASKIWIDTRAGQKSAPAPQGLRRLWPRSAQRIRACFGDRNEPRESGRDSAGNRRTNQASEQVTAEQLYCSRATRYPCHHISTAKESARLASVTQTGQLTRAGDRRCEAQEARLRQARLGRE